MSPGHSSCGVVLLGLLACDGLAPPDYTGEPKLRMEGNSVSGLPGEVEPRTVRAGLFWHPGGPVDYASFEELVEQPSNGMDLQWPGPVSWGLYDDPTAEQLHTRPSGVKVGIAFPFFYEDTNQNDLRESNERMLAHEPRAAILFAPQALSGADSPTGFAIPAGWHVVSRPFFCAPRTVPAHSDPACGVELGKECADHAACGAGAECLTMAPYPFPAGYCSIPETAESACRPQAAELFINHREPAKQYWVQACTAQSDCSRGFPYQCDFAKGACLPTLSVSPKGEPTELTPRPLCFNP